MLLTERLEDRQLLAADPTWSLETLRGAGSSLELTVQKSNPVNDPLSIRFYRSTDRTLDPTDALIASRVLDATDVYASGSYVEKLTIGNQPGQIPLPKWPTADNASGDYVLAQAIDKSGNSNGTPAVVLEGVLAIPTSGLSSDHVRQLQIHGSRSNDTLVLLSQQRGMAWNQVNYNLTDWNVESVLVKLDDGNDRVTAAIDGWHGSFSFLAGAGADAMVVQGSSGNDLVSLDANRSLFQSPTSRVAAEGFEHTECYGGAGTDRVTFIDSAGNDTLDVSSTRAYLQGATFLNYGGGFDEVEATSLVGGLDRAVLRNITSEQRLTFDATVTLLEGSGFAATISLFERVEAYSSPGSTATVQMNDSPGDDTFYSRPEWSYITGADYLNFAAGFSRISATGSGGFDRAVFIDSAGTDLLTATPTKTNMVGANVDREALNFDWSEGYSTGGSDIARLYDSSGNDVLQSRPNYTHLKSASALTFAAGFRQVEAYASAGTDIAMFFDSAGNDQFDASASRAYMSGNGFLNYVANFDIVDAYSRAGGEDVAILRDSSGDDTFRATPQSVVMESGATWMRVQGFRTASGYASSGGNDNAYFSDSSANDRFEVRPDAAFMQTPTSTQSAAGFDRVFAEASNGGNDDQAWMFDSTADDLFEASQSTARIQSSSYLLQSSGFDRVVVTRADGQDTTQFGTTTFVLERHGNWPDRLSLKPFNADDVRLEALRRYELPAIYTAYGITPLSSDIDRIDAIRDWVARTAVHPTTNIHHDYTTANLVVLPLGTTWANVNRQDTPERLEADVRYWQTYHHDGFAMLDALLGTLNTQTGIRGNDGMMAKIESSRYQIRDINTYRFVQCTSQSDILRVLLAAAGYRAVLISVPGHDTTAVFMPQLGKWVWEDPTFNDRYTMGSSPYASPTELLQANLAGGDAYRSIQRVTRLGPTWDPTYYANEAQNIYFNQSLPPPMDYLLVSLKSDTLGGRLVLDTVCVRPGRERAEPFPYVDGSVAFPTG